MKKSKFRKFLDMFNIFELNLSQRSYKSPLFRIFGSLLTMLVVCTVRFSITIPNPVLNIAVSLPMLAIMILSILCLFIASVECLQVGDNRKKDKARMQEQEKYK